MHIENQRLFSTQDILIQTAHCSQINDCGLFQVPRMSPSGSHIHFRRYVFNQFLHISWSSHLLVVTDIQKMHVTKAGNKDTVAGRLNRLTESTEKHSGRAGIWTQVDMTRWPRCICHQSHPATATARKTGSQDSSAPSWRWKFQDGASVPRSRNEKETAWQGHKAQRSVVDCQVSIPQWQPKLNSNSETLRTDRDLEMFLSLWLEGSSREQTVTWEAMQRAQGQDLLLPANCLSLRASG